MYEVSFYSNALVEHPAYAWRAAVDAIPPQFSRDYILLGFRPEALYAPLNVFDSHTYIVGPSNSGKTSRVLVPWLSQFIRADKAVWSIDCKPDEALLGHLQAEASGVRRRVQLFSMQPGVPSDFTLDLFSSLSLNPRTPRQIAQLLLGSLGLNEAAEPFFISQNSSALTAAIERVLPSPLSFQAIAKELAKLVGGGKRFEHARHALDVLEELADVDALNSPTNRLTVAELLRSGDIVYFCLPVSTELKTTCATTAALLLKTAALASKDLALRGESVSRLTLAIDEFQEVASAGDLGDLLGQVRGIGGGLSLILSHQVREQVQDEALSALLESSGLLVLLAPRAHAKALQEWSGEKIVHLWSTGESNGPNGWSCSRTSQETIRSALELNTIQSVNELDGFGIAVLAGGVPYPIFLPHHVEYAEAKRRERSAFSQPKRAPKGTPLAPAHRSQASGSAFLAPARVTHSHPVLRGRERSLREQIAELYEELKPKVLIPERSRPC